MHDYMYHRPMHKKLLEYCAWDVIDFPQMFFEIRRTFRIEMIKVLECLSTLEEFSILKDLGQIEVNTAAMSLFLWTLHESLLKK